MKRSFILALGGLAATAATAETPRVVVDIAPVYSLVAQVMDGVGEPQLLVPANASPHHYSMRPSNARALQEATHVFALDEGLTPWIEGAKEALGPEGKFAFLSEVDGTTLLPNRDGFDFAEELEDDHHDHDDHDHDHEDHEEHDDGHDDHDHEEEHAHDDHADDDHAHEDEHDHDHGDHDPHSWLDPQNAVVWLGFIAEELAAFDPENAEAYRANAAKSQEALVSLEAEISGSFEALDDVNFVVNHDAFQYFEARFGQTALGAISFSDAAEPGPTHISELAEHIADHGITCILTEVGGRQKLIDAVFAKGDATVIVVDPLGVEQPLDGTLYSGVLQNLAEGMTACKG
ncbi:zinc ABC transporter substrate-binding protein [Halocynthiibacter sp. C4]|uniref:zinc ABC transporter substrate-binding protein n=1 Tax=Halocynthiibacter sp. C4 TaxID=2992758 RepID=UPI00237B882E|nr:zinc ABC transporter substrate-binding protein [Halocynthiibacter sp. C4]MDE0590609.1 zinc ABC transporter substrate-binding protein [Halocynthiibacter sp. C4]